MRLSKGLGHHGYLGVIFKILKVFNHLYKLQLVIPLQNFTSQIIAT